MYVDGTSLANSGSQIAFVVSLRLGLKSVGIYLDCTHCLLPSRTFRENEEIDDPDVPDQVRNISDSAIHNMQIDDQPGTVRNVKNAAAKQITYCRHRLLYQY